jgi:hypothetical protein
MRRIRPRARSSAFGLIHISAWHFDSRCGCDHRYGDGGVLVLKNSVFGYEPIFAGPRTRQSKKDLGDLEVDVRIFAA